MRKNNFDNNWIECRIGDICDRIHYGFTASANPDGDGAKYLRITDIQNGKVNWETVPVCDISKSKFEKFKLFPNDLVFARTGGTVGKSYLLQDKIPEKAVFASYLIRVIINNNIYPKYIYNFFQSLNYWSQIELGKTGLKTNVNAQILSKLKFNLAPLPEQRAIVAKIEQLFSELDNGIANLKAAKEKLEIYRQAVLKKAFEGGFTESKEWKSKTLGDIIRISSGNGLTKANRNDDGEYLVYGGNGITGCHDEYMFEDRQLIIGRVGVHCGNTHITEPKSWVTDNAFVVTFDKEEISLKCLYYLIKSLRLNQYANSTAQPVISGGKVYPVKFLFPPVDIQEQLVNEIETRLSVCDNAMQNIDEALKTSEALRQSILKKAFEGKLLSEAELEACRKAPDWEPAEKLLERIKNEK